METAFFESQLNSVLNEYKSLQLRSEHADLSDIEWSDQHIVVTKALSSVQRISGLNSLYSKQAERVINSLTHLYLYIGPLMGVVQALRDDLSNGYLASLIEIVHSEIFSDYLEMADHLLDAGYKDAAAVIAGSTLENHLRGLCSKAGLPVVSIKGDGDVVPKKAEAINSDLVAHAVYSKLEQKSITAWLGLRNSAAHGKYDEYSHSQVQMLIAGVRDFIIRYPA